MPSKEDPSVFCGFESVGASEKTRRVQDIFSRVSSRYDVMNDVMSGGMHRLWKRQFVQQLPLREGLRCLDMAGGTGDVARLYYKRLCQHGMAKNSHLSVCDLNQAMLQEGQRKAWDQGWLHGVSWHVQDASVLGSFADDSQDIYTVAFGLRNMTDLPSVMHQAFRVLKPGGHFYALEFHPMSSDVPFSSLYRAYCHHILPKLGDWVARDDESYRYLAESIATFLPPEGLTPLLKKAGFQHHVYESWWGGIVHWHHAF